MELGLTCDLEVDKFVHSSGSNALECESGAAPYAPLANFHILFGLRFVSFVRQLKADTYFITISVYCIPLLVHSRSLTFSFPVFTMISCYGQFKQKVQPAMPIKTPLFYVRFSILKDLYHVQTPPAWATTFEVHITPTVPLL
jgi:hypothetical protein